MGFVFVSMFTCTFMWFGCLSICIHMCVYCANYSFCFVSALFYLFALYFPLCFINKEEKELGRWRDGEDLGRDEVWETKIRIYCM